VYAVEFSHRSGRDLINVAKKRTNIIPIIEDARHPHKYRMLVGKLTLGRLRSFRCGWLVGIFAELCVWRKVLLNREDLPAWLVSVPFFYFAKTFRSFVP